MAPRLRVLVALAKAPGSIPSTHIMAKIVYNSSSRGTEMLLGSSSIVMFKFYINTIWYLLLSN